MTLEPLHNPKQGQMRVVGLMSGSGSNLRKILELERRFLAEQGKSPFTLVALFSDNAESNAQRIGADYDLPVVMRDLKAFYAARQKPRRDMELRKEFDMGTVQALAPFGATVAAYGGYMSITTEPLIQAFLGVNVHPADLSIMEGTARKYTGDHAVKDALLAGERQLRSSTHLIEQRVDYGRILMRSAPLEVQLPPNFDPAYTGLVEKVAKAHQEKLKERGDWKIFPRTLLCLAEGRFAQDASGSLYFDGTPIPLGTALNDDVLL